MERLGVPFTSDSSPLGIVANSNRTADFKTTASQPPTPVTLEILTPPALNITSNAVRRTEQPLTTAAPPVLSDTDEESVSSRGSSPIPSSVVITASVLPHGVLAGAKKEYQTANGDPALLNRPLPYSTPKHQLSHSDRTFSSPAHSSPPPPFLTATYSEDVYNPLVCSCGRLFKSGQALGGHRGKCKIPRQRLRDLNLLLEDQELNSGVRPAVTAIEVAQNRPSADDSNDIETRVVVTLPNHSVVKSASKKAAVAATFRAARDQKKMDDSVRSNAKQALRGLSTRASANLPLLPLIPSNPFDVNSYRVGRVEIMPQHEACVVMIHPQTMVLPEKILNYSIQTARAKFHLSKLDDDGNDPVLKAYAYSLPEDPETATLQYSRDVPRKLLYINPGAKVFGFTNEIDTSYVPQGARPANRIAALKGLSALFDLKREYR